MNARAGRLLAGADAAVSEVSPANTLGVLMLVGYLFFLPAKPPVGFYGAATAPADGLADRDGRLVAAI